MQEDLWGDKDKRTEDTISWREKLGNEEECTLSTPGWVLHEPSPCRVVLVLLCRCISYRNLLCLSSSAIASRSATLPKLDAEAFGSLVSTGA
ncbi:hypothetical protein VTO73DRAFT_7180 [Trametes versicolor]